MWGRMCRHGTFWYFICKDFTIYSEVVWFVALETSWKLLVACIYSHIACKVVCFKIHIICQLPVSYPSFLCTVFYQCLKKFLMHLLLRAHFLVFHYWLWAGGEISGAERHEKNTKCAREMRGLCCWSITQSRSNLLGTEC